MPIDRFTKQRFEAALPLSKKTGEPLWKSLGFYDGEWSYFVPVGKVGRILIRSSVGDSGLADDTGEDSIRLWGQIRVIDADGRTVDWRSLPKVDAYTTRVNGWEHRMLEKLRTLWDEVSKYKSPIPSCPTCNNRQGSWITKAGPNIGRPATKCYTCGTGFAWLDKELEGWQEPAPTAEPSQPTTPTKNGNTGSSKPAPSAEKSGSKSEDSTSVADTSPEPSTKTTHSGQVGSGSTQVEEYDLFADAEETAEQAWKEGEEAAKKATKDANQQQVAAIEAPLDMAVAVLAGPGSGKTFVIERRYAHLLKNGVKPDNIIAVTFSAAMAADLLTRIVKHNPVVAGSGAESQICTIHALCNRILVSEGYKRSIIKRWQMKQLLQELAAEFWAYNDDPERGRPAWDELYGAFGNAKSKGLVPGDDYHFYAQAWGEFHAERLTKARAKFDRALDEMKCWTFPDMLYNVDIRLREDEAFRVKWQQRFQYVIIDEGQDTNRQSMRILTTLAEPQNRLFIVGDPDQLLYRFTGATPEENLYDGFTNKYLHRALYMLETNYRSTREIVQRSNALIARNYQGSGGPYEELYHKNLLPRVDAMAGRAFHWQEYDTPDEEAAAVVEQIVVSLAEGREPGDIFVCTRTRAQLGFLEGPLTRAGVPFINITGGSFWLLKHIADVLGYVRLAHDNNNREAFKRVYNIASKTMVNRQGEYCATRYLGRAFMQMVDDVYDRQRLLDVAADRYSYRSGVEDLVYMMDSVQARLENEGVAAAMQAVVDLCYERFLREDEGLRDDDDSSKLADVETAIDVAKSFGKDAAKFFDAVDAAIQAAQDAKDKKWDKYVVLSTIHRLKGMERPVVVGMGWSEGETRFSDGTTLPCGLLPHTFSMIPPPQNGVLAFDGMAKMEDERCIAFVAITRAKEEVYLSGVRQWRRAKMWASRFIKEMGLV